MKKLVFKHEQRDFIHSIGATKEEGSIIANLVSEILIEGAKIAEEKKKKKELQESDYSMSRTLDEVLQKLPFTPQPQHYILLGMVLEKAMTTMERAKIAELISDMAKDMRLEMKAEDLQDAIKN